MKFLGESIDAPRALTAGKTQCLPNPMPGLNEYRRYYGHTTEQVAEQNADGEETTVDIPTAKFVSVLNNVEPTVEQWNAILSDNGYSDATIAEIMAD